MSFEKIVNSTYFDVVVVLALLSIAVFIPPFAFPEAGDFASAVAAVFAVAAGFFINDAMSNYLRLQTLIAEGDATFISLVHATRSAPHIESANLERAIDNYLIKTLDYVDLNYIAHTQTEFDAVLTEIDKCVGDPSSPEAVDESLQKDRETLIFSTQEMALAARPNLTVAHWVLLLTLGFLVCLSLLAMRDHTLLSGVAIGLMMAGTYAILVVLRDIDNNKYLVHKLAFKTAGRVFHALKLPPYYPPGAIKDRVIPDEEGDYRTKNEKGEVVVVKKGG